MKQLLESIKSLDEAIIAWSNQIVNQYAILDLFLRFFAQWLVYLVPVLLLIFWFYIRYGSRIVNYLEYRIKLFEVAIAGILGWQVISRIIKQLWFRPRPYAADQPVKELFFHRPDESFPSDHTILFFGLATYLYLIGWKKAGHWTLTLAILVSLARIVTAIHWPTDILGGAVVGMLTAYGLWYFRQTLRRYISEPVTKFIGKLGL